MTSDQGVSVGLFFLHLFASMGDRSKLVHLLKPNLCADRPRTFRGNWFLGEQKVIETPETDGKKRHGYPAACPMMSQGS
jgi:hypothetical protein